MSADPDGSQSGSKKNGLFWLFTFYSSIYLSYQYSTLTFNIKRKTQLFLENVVCECSERIQWYISKILNSLPLRAEEWKPCFSPLFVVAGLESYMYKNSLSDDIYTIQWSMIGQRFRERNRNRKRYESILKTRTNCPLHMIFLKKGLRGRFRPPPPRSG